MMRVAARKGPSFVRPITGPPRRILIGAPSSAANRQFALPSLDCQQQTKYTNQNMSASRDTRKSSNSSNNSARLTANVLFAVAAVVSLRPIMTMAEGRTARMQDSNNNDEDQQTVKTTVLKYANGNACPVYGCPLYPLDIVPTPPEDPNHNVIHAPESLQALADIRSKTRDALSEDDQKILDTTARNDMATLTMTGFKGGPEASQINQDRALAVGPYLIGDESDERTERRLIGVLDGHASRGEIVSGYVVKELPIMLAEKLRKALGRDGEDSSASSSGPQDDEVSITKRVLHETFVDLDRTAPADPSGGCTASVVLLQGENIYVANAGDSQSFVAVYRKSTNTTRVIYTSREDKPHLPDERQRVEEMGGYVYVPVRGTSRVVYVNPRTGSQTGLAMSRSLGDWIFGRIGVIPDPIVDVINIPDVVSKELELSHAMRSECWTVDDDGVVSRVSNASECEDWDNELGKDEEDDVYIFAVSCTDGMLDYVRPQAMANLLGLSLFEEGAVHPASACELLVSTAAQGWAKYRQGGYRDDIAISVTTMRIPPAHKNVKERDTATTWFEKDEL